MNEYFEGLEKNHFREGITNLEKSWDKCVEFWGEYVYEK